MATCSTHILCESLGWAPWPFCWPCPSCPKNPLTSLFRTPRVFNPVQCHHYRHQADERRDVEPTPAPRWMMNYDMEPSIARSDSFDVHTYELTLDVTDYSYQLLDAHAAIELEVLDAAATDLWFDLVELTVDVSTSMALRWLLIKENQRCTSMRRKAAGQLSRSTPSTCGTKARPIQDPYWGGFYFVSDYIYNLGIGLTTIPPNFGKVWYPCFDNFVERATYTYHVTSAGGRTAHCQGHLIGEQVLAGDTIQRSFELTHPITTHQSAIAVAPYVDSNYVHTGAYGDVPVRLTGKPEHIGPWSPNSRIGFCHRRLGILVGAVRLGTRRVRVDHRRRPRDPHQHRLPAIHGGRRTRGQRRPVQPRTRTPLVGRHRCAAHPQPHVAEGRACGIQLAPVCGVERRRRSFHRCGQRQPVVCWKKCHIQDNGFHPLSPMPDEEIYGRHTYYKGASIVHNLRAYLGDELFRSGMQSVLAQLYDSYMDAAQFEATLEEVTGVDMTPWFEAQVLQPGFSTWVLDSAVTAGAQQSTLHLQQKLRACDNYHMSEPLDVAVWDANWNRYDTEIVASGQYDEVVIDHPGIDQPALIALNPNGRLNQGRMDFMYTIDDTEGIQNLPWVQMRVGCDAMPEGDSALVRVEHHWAAPDQGPVGPYVDELSTTHFWVVDGIWPEGTHLDARLQYYGNDSDALIMSFTVALRLTVFSPGVLMRASLGRSVNPTNGNPDRLPTAPDSSGCWT